MIKCLGCGEQLFFNIGQDQLCPACTIVNKQKNRTQQERHDSADKLNTAEAVAKEKQEKATLKSLDSNLSKKEKAQMWDLRKKKEQKKQAQREQIEKKERRENTILLRAIKNVMLTTETVVELPIKRRIEIITSECVSGMNIFRDIFAGITDFVGGRSHSTEGVLGKSIENALFELKHQAYKLGGNAVVGVKIDCNEISGKDKSMILVVASGTAVEIDPEYATPSSSTETNLK